MNDTNQGRTPMRAIVTRLKDDLQREKVLVTDWPAPQNPVGNQVKTRTLYSGVTNGTERNDLIRGNYAHADAQLPAGWGYQNVGQVVEVGPDVKRLQAGDVLYMSQDHMEYCVIPEDGLLIRLPHEVDLRHAALFGMASVAMHCCSHAELRMGQRFLIVGAGFIGQVATQIANLMGARVTLCDVDHHRLDVALAIGAAEEVLDVSGDGWERLVQDATYDGVLDVAGVKGMETRLIAAARKRGTVLFIAGRFEVNYVFNVGQMHEITIKQNSHFDNDDLANICRLATRGTLKIGPLIQDIVPVAEARSIYDTLRDAPGKLFGTVFVW
jgi:2-desacetyl-2-hydroxyethyl bacteriochlorophyllide A dehydrogenase